MKKSRSKVSLGHLGLLVYYLSIWIYFVCGSLSHSMLGQSATGHLLTKVGTYVSMLGLFCRIWLMRRVSKRSYVLLLVSAALAIATYYFSDSWMPLIVLLSLIGAEGSSSRKIGQIYIGSTGVIVALATILSQLGMIQDRLFTRLGGIVRHSFGMTYVTVWAGYVFFICAVILYCRRNKLCWSDCLLCAIASYVTYTYCNARLEAIALIAMVLILLVYPKIQNGSIFKAVTVYSFLISCFMVYALQIAYTYAPEKLSFLDLLMTGRLSETDKVLAAYDFTLFGQPIRMQGNGTINFDKSFGYFFIDTFYINYALEYGVLFMGLLALVLSVVFRRLYANNYKRELVFLAFACYHGVIISCIVLPFFNPLFLIAYADCTKRTEIRRIASHHF